MAENGTITQSEDARRTEKLFAVGVAGNAGITGLNRLGKAANYKRGEKMEKGTRQYMAGLQSPCKSCMGKNCSYTCEGFWIWFKNEWNRIRKMFGVIE